MSKKRIAYSGIEGAFAHIVAKRLFPDEEYVSHGNFRETYEAVEDEECDYAVLPIDNSYSGEVTDVMDLLFEGDLYINALYSLPVTQNLLGIKGSRIEDIRKVVSQPKALEQCDRYIREKGFETIQTSNTARAAREIARLNDKTIAAIASIETADIYGLDVLEEQINEKGDNTTRFVVLSKKKGSISGYEPKHHRFIIIFTVQDKAGALLEPLQAIARYDYNMTVIHSRPVKERKWQYYFYVEIDGDHENENGRKMKAELVEACPLLKVLGPHSEYK